MTKSFAIYWLNHNGSWRLTPGPLYPTRKAADRALDMLGLKGSPAYRVKEIVS